MAIDNSCFIPLTSWVEPERGEAVERNLAWPLDYTCCTSYTNAITAAGDDEGEVSRIRGIWTRAAAAAIDVMFTKTCSVYDLCTYCFRPCLPHTCCGGNDNLGQWFCSDECSRVSLDLHDWVNPFYDVISVTTYDGDGNDTVLVPGTDYEIDGHLLIPYMSGGLWPWPRQSRQYPLNYASPDPDVLIPTWAICVRTGRMPPQSVINGAGALACNMFNACMGVACDIPANAVSVTKEGVTVRLETNILKGIPLVAVALDTYGDCKKAAISRLIDPGTWIG